MPHGNTDIVEVEPLHASRQLLLDDLMHFFIVRKPKIFTAHRNRIALGVDSGDRVTFIVEGNTVRIINSAGFALQRFQEQMKGEAEKAGFFSEEDVANWITQSRRDEAAQ